MNKSSTVPAPPPESTWHLIRESLRGSHRDLTAMPVGRAIILLAVPMVLEMMMESVFAVADIFWVAKLGPDAIAAVGLTESMLVIIYALAMGLSIGCTAVVARRIGEKDPDRAAVAAVQGILLAVVLGALLGTAGVILAPRLLHLMGASPAVQAIGVGYTRVMLGGSTTVVLLFLINAAFRGAGDATIAMRTLWLGNAINIVLGPLLVFGIGPFPRMGVTGAAVATTIGRGIGVLYQVRALASARGRLTVRRDQLRVDGQTLKTIVNLSGAAVFQSFIGTASWVGLIRIISTFGSAALAGYTIAIRVVLFALLPSFGMANAAATLVGQNLGAGQPAEAERAVWKAARYNAVFLGAVGLLFVVAATPLLRLFTSEPQVVAHGATCLRIVSAGFLFYAFGLVVTQAFNGAGDTRTPTLINLFIFWMFEIPLAYLLSTPLGFGPRGAFLSITIAFSTMALVAVLLFRRGRWKAVRV